MARIVRTLQEANAELNRLESLINQLRSEIKQAQAGVVQNRNAISAVNRRTSGAGLPNSQIVQGDIKDHIANKSNPHLTSDENLLFTDITDNNVSSSMHGFCPKTPDDVRQLLRGDGTWGNLISKGSLQLDAAATTTVNDANVTASCIILAFPTNAAAATLVSGAKSPYEKIASRVVGTSFEVATADGNSAVGTETFNYLIFD
jgi:hypothetical protein